MHVFLDTMVYLKCLPFELIDFRGIFRSDAVTVQVPRITLRKLEKLRDTHVSSWTRSRAAQVLSFLEARMLLGDQMQPGVDMHFIPSTPLADLTKYGLNPAWDEDWLLAAVLEGTTEKYIGGLR